MSEVRYRKLNQTEESDTDETDRASQSHEEFLAQQFERPPTKVPWKAIIFALILFILGSALLIVGSLIVTGHIDPVKHNERFWPLILLGSLMFIPGSYHTYFAYKAFRGDPDWDFEEFPDF
jgi:fatty acid desaturase